MRRVSLLILGLVLPMCGCIQPRVATKKAIKYTDITYDVAMVKVERPQETRDRYGTIVEVELSADNRYHYEDLLVDSFFLVDKESIIFALHNKTEHALKIIWDESAFIDLDGSAVRIGHRGVKYDRISESSPPGVVPAHGKIEEFAIPVNRVYYSSLRFASGWKHKPIITPEESFTVVPVDSIPPLPQEIASKAQARIGQRFGLLMPLEIQGVVNEYTFWFEIKAYRASAPRIADY